MRGAALPAAPAAGSRLVMRWYSVNKKATRAASLA
jgi:hypothetical protein